MWFLQDPAPPFPGVLNRIASSPGAMGVFHTDPSQRVVAISGRVASIAGVKKRRHLTFVLRSSALIGLALGERRGGTIEWEKWKGEVVTIDHPSSRLSVNVQVEGSRVFIQETLKGEVGFTIYDFSPGARKEQRDHPYTSQRIMLTGTPSAWWPQKSWEVSGDAIVLFEVGDLNILHNFLVFRLTTGIFGSPGDSGAFHRHCLVRLNFRRAAGVIFGPPPRLNCYERLSQVYIASSAGAGYNGNKHNLL